MRSLLRRRPAAATPERTVQLDRGTEVRPSDVAALRYVDHGPWGTTRVTLKSGREIEVGKSREDVARLLGMR